MIDFGYYEYDYEHAACKYLHLRACAGGARIWAETAVARAGLDNAFAEVKNIG